MAKIRIQKLLSDAGVASRRAIEQMILEGRISVNGDLVAQLPCFVEGGKDEILIDGKPVPKYHAAPVYILVNKPKGVVCTEYPGPQGEPRVIDIIPPQRSRVFVVGTVDDESTGILLVTNDGELAERMTHARYGLIRKYVVEAEGRLTEDAIAALKAGMFFDGRRTRRAYIKVLSRSLDRTLLEVDVAETHNRQVRRMLAKVGNKVRRLKRVAPGPLTDDGLKIGHWRYLLPGEVRRLKAGDVGTMPEIVEEVVQVKPSRGPGSRGPKRGAALPGGATPRGHREIQVRRPKMIGGIEEEQPKTKGKFPKGGDKFPKPIGKYSKTKPRFAKSEDKVPAKGKFSKTKDQSSKTEDKFSKPKGKFSKTKDQFSKSQDKYPKSKGTFSKFKGEGHGHTGSGPRRPGPPPRRKGDDGHKGDDRRRR